MEQIIGYMLHIKALVMPSQRMNINTSTGEPNIGSAVASGIVNSSHVMQIYSINNINYTYAGVSGGVGGPLVDSVATQCNINSYLFSGCQSTPFLDKYDTSHYAQYAGLIPKGGKIIMYIIV